MQFSKNIRITMRKKQAIAGYFFVLPFLLGFVFFFLFPFLESIMYSFSRVQITAKGYELISVKLDNYYQLLYIDPNFRRDLYKSVIKIITNVPLIIIFSFFAATLLNQKFRGRALARSIFFLPVILTSGVIIAMENSDIMINTLQSASNAQGSAGGGGMNTTTELLNLRSMLYATSISPVIINYIVGAVDGIYGVIVSSGVQILIFLAGLQSIPRSLYEASDIEGATGWENFWKITFPMISSLILVNMVYTIIDSFTKPTNTMMKSIHDVAFSSSNFGLSAAMSWLYFIIVLVILGISVSAISKKLFYYD
jgi:ABC-type sugar transport system permease subunit